MSNKHLIYDADMRVHRSMQMPIPANDEEAMVYELRATNGFKRRKGSVLLQDGCENDLAKEIARKRINPALIEVTAARIGYLDNYASVFGILDIEKKCAGSRAENIFAISFARGFQYLDIKIPAKTIVVLSEYVNKKSAGATIAAAYTSPDDGSVSDKNIVQHCQLFEGKSTTALGIGIDDLAKVEQNALLAPRVIHSGKEEIPAFGHTEVIIQPHPTRDYVLMINEIR